jgi:hypothetical protein
MPHADTDERYSDGQLMSWLRGISGHNLDDGCCPDFSCCRPELRVPLEEREAFMTAYVGKDTMTLERMNLRFLGNAIHTPHQVQEKS